jgi:aspartate aminotransferase-like enzyme
MPSLRPEIDPDGLLEYSVVFTDRALNHMSQKFQGVMREVSGILKEAYRAPAAIVVPGSGSFGMEAVARQFATGRKTLVIRNGWFSYRWTQIFEMGRIPSEQIVLKARPVRSGRQAPYAPPAVEEVVAAIRQQRPDLVFAPHVETSAGTILPDAYLRAVAQAAHDVGGLFVLDSVASGAIWVDMQLTGVDVLVSAPQKGWSGSPCCAFVMLSERARGAIEGTSSSSFTADLKKWLQIMQSYEAGGQAYHLTLPTDALTRTLDAMLETRACGFEKLRSAQIDLGRRVCALLADRGFPSVAAEGYQAPGVVVSYTDGDRLHSGRAFVAEGLQIAAGVPLQCDEPADFKTFRIGLFGLDKLNNVDRTVKSLDAALGRVLGAAAA